LTNLIVQQLNQLPSNPGVYLFKDAEGTILYVGKAANLRNRVKSYFGSRQKLPHKLQHMVARIHDLDYFITTSEQEALILELNLIKHHHPYYNVRLKDDKTFPYLKIALNEEWPRVYITRHPAQDGGRYFGPFASAKSIRQTMKIIKRIFPFRSCSKPITETDSRPCLWYHVGKCLAPCIGAVSKEEYSKVIKQVILFLEGKQGRVVKLIENQMNKAAKELEFEKASLLRDQIQAIHEVIEGQRIATTVNGEQDVIAFAQDKDQAYVQIFFIRSGKMIGRESFVLQGTRSEEPPQIITSFIKQFYQSSVSIPPLLLLQYPVEEQPIIEEWLRNKRGNKVSIIVPQRGNKKRLVDIVAENAQQGLAQLKIKQLATPDTMEKALNEIARELRLPHSPLRMEGYDISNIQGTSAVGSMVVFEKGKPKPAHYRRFRIKTVSGANDYAMLNEVIKRRFKHSGSTSTSGSWITFPDLVLIDGGKGQLSSAQAALHEAGVTSIPIASLAKENEYLFIPQETKPIILPHTSPGLQLLQRLRDEAHRFALGYHQKIRRKQTFASAFDTITGIGPKRKRTLLRKFGSARALQQASTEELASVQGISQSLARRIKEYL